MSMQPFWVPPICLAYSKDIERILQNWSHLRLKNISILVSLASLHLFRIICLLLTQLHLGKKHKNCDFLGVFICAQDPVKSKELKQIPKLLTGSRSVPLLPLSGLEKFKCQKTNDFTHLTIKQIAHSKGN